MKHDQLGQVGIDDICHVATAAAAANLLSLKQLDNNVENVTAAVPIDDPNCNDKNNLSGDVVVGIVDEIHLSKKKPYHLKKLGTKKILPIVVRKSLCPKKQMFPMQHIFWKLHLPNPL